ncbi:MAG: T9SS type A sorting domain-containing protein [Niastella sp.]|uniref:T9SS type A sorting domain-containing protein n=1 Tax=Niastella sp. TaxID=1869183 RepID=UPI00389AE46F
MKKHISRTQAFMLCLCMSFSYYGSFSQCGTAPTAGTTQITNTNTIVNSYYQGTANAVKGTTSVSVGTLDVRGSATALSNGDMVLIIQMQGADFNTSNNDTYGDGVAGGSASGYLTSNLVAGSYEYNVVSGISGGTITLGAPLSHNYYARAFTSSAGIQTFQVIRIQREYNLTINNGKSITAPNWNGSTGGVVVLEVANQLTFGNASSAVTVDGKGFRGGGGKRLDGSATTTVTRTDYVWNSPVTTAANTTGGAKGEGIAGTPIYYLTNGATTTTTNTTIEGYVNGSMGRGAPGNAGGGGTDGDPSRNQYNPGGGGGGNGGSGGQGGSGWDGGTASASTYPTGGHGGAAYTQASEARFVMGGGGGAGTSNNATAGTQDYLSSGGVGGGIIIIRAKTFSGNGIISANGAAANDITSTFSTVTDAAGGGGAGGSIIVLTNTSTAAGSNTIRASATGGKGGNMETYWAHGPGGGGGGGYVLNNALGGTITVTGGANGLTHKATKTDPVDQPYGSSPGAIGVVKTITGTLGFINLSNPASPCGALPITLTQWSGVYKNNKTYLNWQAENALNFSHFVVEHGTDGIHFSPLGQVSTVASTAFSQSYSYEDAFPVEGVNYYRLKMVDLDGKYAYSGILLIRTNGSGIQISATPNPFTDHVVISIQSTTNETASLRLLNSDGKLVWRKTIFVSAGNNVQYFNDLQSLPKGVYIIKVDKGNSTEAFKMIKR